MDYTTPTLRFNGLMNTAFSSIMYEQMERESAMILESMEAQRVMLEAVDPGQKKQNFFVKLIEFIKKVFSAFTEKVKALFQNHKKWLDANSATLENIDYAGLEIEIVPFWNQPMGSLSGRADTISGFIRRVVSDPSSAQKYKDFESLKSQVLKQYLDENDDLANGLKNFFRTGKAQGPLKAEKISGDALKNQVLKEFRVYCTNYQSQILPVIQQQVNAAERDLKAVEQALSKRNVNEQFVVIENTTFSNVGLSMYPVMEAEENNNQQNTNNNDANKQQSPSKVNVTDRGGQQSGDGDNNLSSMSSDDLTLMKNVAQVRNLVVTSLMTVCEERFNAYITAMRQIVSARGPKKKNQANEDSATAADQVNVNAKK